MLAELTVPVEMIFSRSSDSTGARLRCWLLPLLIFSFLLSISSCGLDIEDPTPPSPPVWVEKSVPEDWPERGIDANDFRGIYLEWEANIGVDILEYIIYRAQYFAVNDSIGNYNPLIELKSESYQITEFIDHQSMPNVEYFYKMKSKNSVGVLSEYSDSVYYCNLRSIRTETLNPNSRTSILPPDKSLTWYYSTLIDMENYCITVLTEEDSLVVRQLFQPQNFVGAWESWQFPDDIQLEDGKVYKWRIDIGAGYINDKETSGAESSWARFLFQEF